MSLRPKGKHVTVDISNPQALGICDYTGFVHKHSDLVKQMEWRGNALTWTGLYVGKDYADIPNEQLRPPILPPDPIPIVNARPQYPTNQNWNVSTGFTWNTFTTNFNDWASTQDGVPCLPEDERLTALRNFKWQMQ